MNREINWEQVEGMTRDEVIEKLNDIDKLTEDEKTVFSIRYLRGVFDNEKKEVIQREDD